MFKLLIGFICFLFLIYFAINYLTNKDVTLVDLSEGKLIDNSGYLDESTPTTIGKNNFTYSFWLYITKPPNDEPTVFLHTNGLNTSINLTINKSVLKLSLDDSMHLYFDNYLYQKWNHIAITYLAGTLEFYVNSVLEKTLLTPVQTIYTSSLATSNINIGSYDLIPSEWQPTNAYIAHFTYDPINIFTHEKIKALYKQQFKSITNKDSLEINLDFLKNGVPYN